MPIIFLSHFIAPLPVQDPKWVSPSPSMQTSPVISAAPLVHLASKSYCIHQLKRQKLQTLAFLFLPDLKQKSL